MPPTTKRRAIAITPTIYEHIETTVESTAQMRCTFYVERVGSRYFGLAPLRSRSCHQTRVTVRIVLLSLRLSLKLNLLTYVLLYSFFRSTIYICMEYCCCNYCLSNCRLSVLHSLPFWLQFAYFLFANLTFRQQQFFFTTTIGALQQHLSSQQLRALQC